MAKQLHHASVVVDDLPAAIAFFAALGMELEGQAPIEGEYVDRVNALDGVRVDIAMMRAEDGDGRLEQGCAADAVVLGPDWSVRRVWAAGVENGTPAPS